MNPYDNGKAMVLDNNMTQVYEDRRLHDYRPIASMDLTGWWRHRRTPKAGAGAR